MFYPLVDCSYKVELQTSDLLGAGTSANGVISLLGKLAEAGPIQLVNSGGSFQRGSLDMMTLDNLPDIGSIQQVLGCAVPEPAFTACWKETRCRRSAVAVVQRTQVTTHALVLHEHCMSAAW